MKTYTPEEPQKTFPRGRIPAIDLQNHILDLLCANKTGVHFNEIFRYLQEEGLVGSYSTVSKTLKDMLKKKLITVKEEPNPGLPKKIYHATKAGDEQCERTLLALASTLIPYIERAGTLWEEGGRKGDFRQFIVSTMARWAQEADTQSKKTQKKRITSHEKRERL